MTQNVFVSYAREDAISENNLIDEFLKHGKPRVRRGEISIFKDTERIDFGEQWRKRIDEELEKTDIAILMISVNFLNSDFIFEHELKVLLEKHKNDGVRILPVLLGTCDWEYEKEIEQFQIFPDANEPLASMNENLFAERALQFFQTVLPANYTEDFTNDSDFQIEKEQSENFEIESKKKSAEQIFEESALERWDTFRDDVKNRSYTVEEAADFNKVRSEDVYSFLKSRGYSKPKAFAKTPWFLTSMQFLELQSEFLRTTKLNEHEMEELFKKYHPNNYLEYQSIFNTLLAWGNKNLIDKKLGKIYWGQNTSSSDLGSVGWIYWKEGRKTSKDKYFLFRVGAKGDISPSFWWNTQNYSNEDKQPFNSFNFQSSVLEKFAKIGFSEFGGELTQNNENLASVAKDNAFTKRDHFVDLAKLSDEKTIQSFLEIFEEIIEEINLTH